MILLRYLLGDQRGNLYVLVLLKNNNGTVINISIDGLGTTSIPECISYLDNGVVYIGSVYGDSQLIRLKSKPEPDGNHIEVIDSYPNIGPILDMCVVESDKGNFQVVTCSGAFKDGSIRVIRSGIGIQEQASVDVPGIKGIWSLRANDEKQFDRYLVQSFVGETRVLSIRGEELSEDEIPGFASEQTIFVSNVAGGLILQVTGSRAVLIDGTSLQSVDTYVAPKAITIATSNYQQLTVALSGAEIILFEIDTTARKLKQVFTFHATF
jgi:DNA damage-binding protein 1